jgi:hypothetical protein
MEDTERDDDDEAELDDDELVSVPLPPSNEFEYRSADTQTMRIRRTKSVGRLPNYLRP